MGLVHPRKKKGGPETCTLQKHREVTNQSNTL
jgi:hypothetical protein